MCYYTSRVRVRNFSGGSSFSAVFFVFGVAYFDEALDLIDLEVPSV